MTVAPDKGAAPDAPPAEGQVRLTIDDRVVDAPKGELLIRACERLGIIVPRFCDHPLLEPSGACRQCLVEVEMGGRPMPKPQASCTMTVAEGMVVRTQHTSPVADKAQQGVMELLLINHPLDCPICDKGGECPLQNQAMSNGRSDSRFVDTKRTFPKPIAITSQVLLDRERCVLCQRCTRFDEEIAGDNFIDLLERGAGQQIGTAHTAALTGAAAGLASGQSYFSGNTIQICPVGALTSAAYRFRSRPFDLVSTDGVCEHCSSGCAQRVDTRRGTVLRRLAGNDPAVNEEWNCDKGRFAFRYLRSADRITRPMVRGTDGVLAETSWTEALSAAAHGLAAARSGGIGVLAGGRLTVEDAYAYGKFARVVAGTNDVDFRARPHSAEELDFLAAHVVGKGPDQLDYARLEAAPAVLCVAFEPEEESPIVFLRLRKAARKHGQKVFHLGSWSTPAVLRTATGLGVAEPSARDNLIPAVPGAEAAVLADVAAHVVEALRGDGMGGGGVILVGERAAEVPGLYSAVSALAARTGAVVGWVPRRAGERGALDAGAAPTLLPGGRLVSDATARAEVESAWGLAAGTLPVVPGRDTDEILAAAAIGDLAALVVGGLDPHDLADPAAALAGLREVGFLVSLELHACAVTGLADVVLPVAPDAQRSGSYLNWEGRARTFGPALDASGVLPDCRVLDTLAVEMDLDLFTQTPAVAAGELARLGYRTGVAPPPPSVPAGRPLRPGFGQAVLASWRQLVDSATLAIDEPALAGTARPALVRLNPATAERLGLTEGEPATVRTERGAITLTVALSDLPDGVVWLPGNSGDSRVRAVLGAGHGDLVGVTA
ncbi:MAG: NADH-quinone oxidoreductase subunit G [Pseudonocardia sp.]